MERRKRKKNICYLDIGNKVRSQIYEVRSKRKYSLKNTLNNQNNE